MNDIIDLQPYNYEFYKKMEFFLDIYSIIIKQNRNKPENIEGFVYSFAILFTDEKFNKNKEIKQIFEIIKSYNVDLNIEDYNGVSFLMYFLKSNHFSNDYKAGDIRKKYILDFLINYMNVDYKKVDKIGNNIFFYCNLKEDVEYFYKAGTDASHFNNNGANFLIDNVNSEPLEEKDFPFFKKIITICEVENLKKQMLENVIKNKSKRNIL